MLTKQEIFHAASEMYRVLLNHSLCACTHRWKGQGLRVLVKKCQRCTVMDRWEALTGKPPHPAVPVQPDEEDKNVLQFPKTT